MKMEAKTRQSGDRSPGARHQARRAHEQPDLHGRDALAEPGLDRPANCVRFGREIVEGAVAERDFSGGMALFGVGQDAPGAGQFGNRTDHGFGNPASARI